MTKKILSTNIKEMLKIRLMKNTKDRPYSNDWRGTNPKNYNKDYEANDIHNIGIPTGKVNNIIVVDLDSYKWEAEHPFYILYNKETFINDINTYCVKTTSGGYHLFFEYDKDIKNVISKKYEIDIFTDDKYVVGIGSKVKGKTYSVINDVNIKPLPQKLKDFLMEVIKSVKKDKKTKTKKVDNKNISSSTNTNHPFEVYISKRLRVDDDYLISIFNNLPKKFINNYDDWRKFTSACKLLDKKVIWDTISKKGSGYDLDDNNIRWDNIEPNKFHLLHILDECKSNIGNSFKYTQLLKDKMVYDKKYNREKLGGKKFNVIHNHYSYVIKSDTGTGKTTQFVQYLKTINNKKVIAIADRQALIKSLKNDFKEKGIDFTSYRDENNKMQPVAINSNILVCINSILHYNLTSYDLNNTILFLDEISATLKTLILSPTIKDRIKILNIFRKLIKGCCQVIAVDADIDDVVSKFIKDTRGRDDVKLIVNMYKHNKGVKAYELRSEKIMINKLKKDTEYILCCDSASKAKSIWKKLDDPTIKLITDDSVKDDEDYTGLSQWKKLIISPKVLRGLNDDEFYRNLYLYHKEHTIDPDDMLQQMTRCRKIKAIYFIFTKKNYRYVPPLKEHIEIQNEIKKLSEELDFIDQDFLDGYLELRKKILYKQEAYGSNKYIHFILLLEQRGVKVFPRIARPKIKGITKKEREETEKEAIDNFDTTREKNKKTIEILNIPISKLEGDYKDEKLIKLCKNDRERTQHFNIIHFRYSLNDELLEKIQKKEDYAVCKYQSNLNKVRFVKKLYENLNISMENLVIDMDKIDKDEVRKMEKEYKLIFRAISEKDFIDDLQRIVVKVSKDLFGNKIIKTLRKQVDGHRYYTYEVDNSFLHFHDFVYSFRKRPTDICDKNIFRQS